MRSVLLAVLLWLVVFGSGSLCQEAKQPSLEEVRKRADHVLTLSDAAARKQVAALFAMVDRLVADDQSQEAMKYIDRALQLNPWNLKYQLVYAKLLEKSENHSAAQEKALLVYEHAESEELIDSARNMLGKDGIPKFEQMKKPPGNGSCLVLVPFQKCDRWLIWRMRNELTSLLGIPVFVQEGHIDEPESSRDRRGMLINMQRRRFIDELMDEPRVIDAMNALALTKADLKDDNKFLQLLQAVLGDSGVAAMDAFESQLEQSRGKDPQWDAAKLMGALREVSKPHQRARVGYIALTPVDIYADDRNFLFGQAETPYAVVSYYRFTANFDDTPPNQKRLVERTLKQCLASAGHVFGVKRCTSPTCSRAFAVSLNEQDAKKLELCRECRRGFQAALGKSTETPAAKK